MPSDSLADLPLVFGFLTVVQQPSVGLVGGYLLLNAQGRPLEFHCTAAVRANRTQEILYGPTLEPYLYGEQIGRTLFQVSKLQPVAIFTDRPAALSAAEHSAAPVWLVLNEAQAPEAEGSPGSATSVDSTASAAAMLRVDAAQTSPAPMHALRCGEHRLACRPADAARGMEDRLEAVVAGFDLAEPFERIRAAIDESQRGAR